MFNGIHDNFNPKLLVYSACFTPDNFEQALLNIWHLPALLASQFQLQPLSN